MPSPGIFITFQTLASTAIQRSEKGTLLILIRDAVANEGAKTYTLTRTSQIPSDLSDDNKAYIERAFIGYENMPNKILLHVDAAESEDLSVGLAWARTQKFDYLCGPPTLTSEESKAIVSFIKDERANDNIYKAVLPNEAADSEGIVNFTASGIEVGEKIYTTAEYCSRIAGIIAGTPMRMAGTYAPLPEVNDIVRLDKAAQDAAIDAGQFIAIHDGVKVKMSRAVNSFQTTTTTKGDVFKKIKIVEILDMIQYDIRTTISDDYIGKFANSYDNKMVLITAIKNYLGQLEKEELLKVGSSVVEIDIDAQTNYLIEHSIDVSSMSEQEIKEANTGSEVFIKMTISPLDAIEDVTIAVTVS